MVKQLNEDFLDALDKEDVIAKEIEQEKEPSEF